MEEEHGHVGIACGGHAGDTAVASTPAAKRQGSGDVASRRSMPHFWTFVIILAIAGNLAIIFASRVDSPSIARDRTLPRALKASGITGNPFEGQVLYKNPVNQAQFDESINSAFGPVKASLKAMRDVPSAYWIDVKAKIKGNTERSLQGILQDASSKSPAEMVVFIWYDLPNRDCKAKASNGEICCKYNPDRTCDYTWQLECNDGLNEYKETYADPFIEVLQKFKGKVPVAIVVEPDSLPNLATNTGNPRCGGAATRQAYEEGIAYAVKQLTSKTPWVAVYIDAAHGGWLGWQNNLVGFMTILKDMKLPMNKVRGFAQNVANYQPLGEAMCPYEPDSGTNRNGYCLNGRHSSEVCCADPCSLAAEWNPANNELNYAQELINAAKSVLGIDAHVIIDTGRNGVTDMRKSCANWCNIRGAGAGKPSTTNTAEPAIIDAYFWLKTPGESDGCTATLPSGEVCPRFDSDCQSIDSIGSAVGEPRAPEAGRWFDYQVKQLAELAHMN
eukprot:TRINITY_DN4907_c0_g1_i3.p1 TRINITY_DN4907_c0_g1~~TRINITY_DN4907_c0_g1_i3.p1  ORF type:complete len:502 (+),score=93.06 TRINITY_DN4907_c0_g1_i3:133-1638(+)